MVGAAGGRSVRGVRGRVVAALPRRWAERLTVMRHDLRMLGGTLRGQTPPYLVPRPPRPPRPTGTATARRDVDRAHLVQLKINTRAAEGRDPTAPTRFPDHDVTVSMRADGNAYEVVVAPGQTLLDAGLDAGAPMPFSCAMGGCATCLVRLVSGQVHLEEPNCLEAEERDEGFILTCVTRPLSDCILEFDPD